MSIPKKRLLISQKSKLDLENIFLEFKKMSKDEVLSEIWSFCYNPTVAWDKYNLPKDEIESSLSTVRAELLTMLSHLFHDAWEEITLPPSTFEEKLLSKKLEKVENAFELVREKISHIKIEDFEIVNSLYSSLLSTKECDQLKILKTMGFDDLESEFLKDAAFAIFLLWSKVSGYDLVKPCSIESLFEIKKGVIEEHEKTMSICKEVMKHNSQLLEILQNFNNLTSIIEKSIIAEDNLLTDEKINILTSRFNILSNNSTAFSCMIAVYIEYINMAKILIDAGMTKEDLDTFTLPYNSLLSV